MSETEDAVSIPRRLTMTRRYGGRLVVAGSGDMPSPIMVLGDQVLEEDARDTMQPVVGLGEIQCKPAVGKGPAGRIVKDTALSVGLDLARDAYWTNLVKWVPPRGKKITKDILAEADPTLMWELETCQPQIIIACGKKAFDAVTNLRLAQRDLQGGWFESKPIGEDARIARVYPIDPLWKFVKRPELLDRLVVDLREVRTMYDMVRGIEVDRIPLNYQVINDLDALRQWVKQMETERRTIFSVDCEWAGNNFVDGQLRSLQIAWTPGHAVFLRFMDDQMQLNPSLPYREAGQILQSYLNRPEIRYVGHHISADFPWMYRWLGLEYFDRCLVDTEFARQTINEHADLGLERLAMAYTDLGRYDVDLMLWIKQNRQEPTDGYGRIPDEILIPYACLRGESLVQLGDRSWSPIRELVNNKYRGYVRAWEDGKVVNRRVTNWHRADVNQQEWFQLRTPSSRSGRWGLMGPVFTPDHEVLTTRGKVRVDRLIPGKDFIITDEPSYSKTQLSVVLGSLLGDGGVARRNRGRAGLVFSQQAKRAPYARWKANVLDSAHTITIKEKPDGSVCCRSSYCRKLVELLRQFPRHHGSINRARKLIITEDLLNAIGVIGLAVWYQDDGVFTKDRECRIICRKLTESEISVVDRWFSRRYGWVSYDRNQGALRFRSDAAELFLSEVSPFMHASCSYKSHLPVGGGLQNLDHQPGPLYAERVLEVVRARSNTRSGNGVRYCLSVEGAENFLTEAGFVSNCRDVDVCIRAYPHLIREMGQDGTLPYYFGLFGPFVSNVFTTFCLHGLPMDIERMNELRALCTFATQFLADKLRSQIAEEAHELLRRRLVEFDPAAGLEAYEVVVNMVCSQSQIEAARLHLKSWMQEQYATRIHAVFEHFLIAPSFNIRSPEHMRRWLYDVKGYTPIKSTNRTDQGLPAIPWSKVLTKDPDQQILYSPSTDKQSLMILSEQYDDDALRLLLRQNAIGNLSKAFLKEPTLDEEGNLVKENGLFFFLSSDLRIHGQFSATETGRPRAWKPNSLNWPSNVAKDLQRVIIQVIMEAHERGTLPDILKRYISQDPETPVKIPSIRSCVQADPEKVFVESDFQTAEIRGLAFISGDEDLIRYMTEPDPEFVLARRANGKVVAVRWSYALSGAFLNPVYMSPDFILAFAEEGEIKERVTAENLLRNADGSLKHPPYDLHWSLAEMVHGKPREMLINKRDRFAAKAGNFGWAYDIQAGTLERKIEADTGIKPEPGTGERIIEALNRRQPVAAAYLHEVEKIPADPGYMVLASGRKRHFVSHPDHIWGIRTRDREGLLSNQGREARNCPMQESVAATAARAANWLLSAYQHLGLAESTTPFVVLYDSVVTHTPIEARFAVAKLHQHYMTTVNTWTYHGRVMNYPIDTEFNLRWSDRPSEAMSRQLDDESWRNDLQLVARAEDLIQRAHTLNHQLILT